MQFFGRAEAPHGKIPAVGVLLANLGTPDAPTPRALRRYLRQFLLDPRVVELPRPLWWTILHLFVLTRRPRASAALYRSIWSATEGSPLLAHSRRQAAGLQAILAAEIDAPVRVALGMRYGNPSIAAALAELERANCRQVLVLPLYPQYAAATTASTFDAVFAELSRWRFVPELRTISGYATEPAYLEALAASVREAWGEEGPAERLLLSFHGIPQRYFDQGDPYHCFCHATARGVRERLGLAADRVLVAFQSKFGREPWLEPATDQTVRALAASGVRSLDIACPGFAADCLETLEEIAGQVREAFLHAGGERFRYVSALNDRPDHLRMLADLARRHLGGWIETSTAERAAAAQRTVQRAQALAAEQRSRPLGDAPV